MIGYLDGTPPIEVFVTHDVLLEAPNWTMDGRWLIMNGNGRLWRLPVEAGDVDLEEIPISDVPALNNDHVLHPDGEHIYVSANDWHIYRASLAGGRARRITEDDLSGRMHFLHGVSPDGTQLAYIVLTPQEGDWWAEAHVFLMPAAGGPSVQLTRMMAVNFQPMAGGSTSTPSHSQRSLDMRKSLGCPQQAAIQNS